jgi:hypothetical protein
VHASKSETYFLFAPVIMMGLCDRRRALLFAVLYAELSGADHN